MSFYPIKVYLDWFWEDICISYIPPSPRPCTRLDLFLFQAHNPSTKLIRPRLRPGSALGSIRRSPDPQWAGGGIPPPRSPSTPSAFRTWYLQRLGSQAPSTNSWLRQWMRLLKHLRALNFGIHTMCKKEMTATANKEEKTNDNKQAALTIQQQKTIQQSSINMCSLCTA